MTEDMMTLPDNFKFKCKDEGVYKNFLYTAIKNKEDGTYKVTWDQDGIAGEYIYEEDYVKSDVESGGWIIQEQVLPIEFKFKANGYTYLAQKNNQVDSVYDIFIIDGNGAIIRKTDAVLSEQVERLVSEKGHWKITEIIQTIETKQDDDLQEVAAEYDPLSLTLLDKIKAFTQVTGASVVIQKNGYEVYVPDFIEGFLADSDETLEKIMEASLVLWKALHGN